MSKVENEEVKEYLIKFVLNDLDNCPLFKRVFGKNFARKSLELNLEKVYTNEFSLIMSGYRNRKDSSITICTNKENDTILSVDDIERNPNIKAIIMHEALHAILSKSKIFCRINKIKAGTGILEYYENGTELGRGLNEGLTNWITNKTGHPIYSYKELTSYIKMIKLARGEERVMKMAKGNIFGNVINQLGMKKSEALSFLSLTDEIYCLGDLIINAEEIIHLLNMKDDENARIELDKNEYYNAVVNSQEYKQIVKESNSSGDIITQMAYFKDIIERKKKELGKENAKIVRIIYEKYFKKTLERLVKKKDISLIDLEAYDYIVKNKLDFPGMEDFKENYDKLDSKYFQKICEEVQLDYESGNLTGFKIKAYEIISNRGRYPINVNFFNRVAKMIDSKDPDSILNLLYLTYIGEDIENINQYSILEIKAGNKTIHAYKKDGQVVDFHQFCKDKPDFVLLDLEEILWCQSNDDIQKKAKDMHPNANVKIIDILGLTEGDNGYVVNNQEKLVVCEEKGKDIYYIIEDGKLILAKLEGEQTAILDFHKRNKPLVVPKKNGIAEKITKSIKGNLLRNIYDDTSCESASTNKHEIFLKNISDMSQYNQDIPKGKKVVEQSEQIEEYSNRRE